MTLCFFSDLPLKPLKFYQADKNGHLHTIFGRE